MTQWHLKSKRKKTGGRRIMPRKKRKYERGSEPTETTIKDLAKRVLKRIRGGRHKVVLKYAKEANVTLKDGKTVKGEIIDVVENKANREYPRRNVITKGAKLRVKVGEKEVLAKVTSRPGQHGVVNAVEV